MAEQSNGWIRGYWVISIALFPVCQLQQHNSDVRCLQCFSALSPEDCQQWVMCGPGEECFTREFVDHQGRQAFRLGCETNMRCNLFQYSQYLIGRRGLSEDSPERCYDCCDSDDCNSRLCAEAVGRHVTPSLPVNTCPPTFSFYNGNCYFLATWVVQWAEARLDCQRRGADLVSINCQQEQDFLVEMIAKLNSTLYPPAVWTGSFWVPSTAQWNWVDNTAVNYTAWGSSQPTSPDYSQHIAMVKDPGHLKSGGWLWSNLAYSYSYGFICERKVI